MLRFFAFAFVLSLSLFPVSAFSENGYADGIVIEYTGKNGWRYNTPTQACGSWYYTAATTSRIPTGVEYDYDDDDGDWICHYEISFDSRVTISKRTVPVQQLCNGSTLPCPEADDNQAKQCRSNSSTNSDPSSANQSNKIGNPISSATGTKFEYSLDWASPRDSRFRFSRTYRSEQIMENSPVSTSFGSGWGSDLDVSIVTDNKTYFNVGRGHVFHSGDGSRHRFSYISAGAVPYRDNNPYRLTWGTSSGVYAQIYSGSGRIDQFKNDGSTLVRRLMRRIWPDGYQIDFTRSSTGRLLEMSDNRGQIAKLFWDNNPDTDIPTGAVTRIEVDTDYDGITFQPDLELVYDYSWSHGIYNSPLAKPRLNGVELKDLSTSATKELWGYGYSNGFRGRPLLLANVSDGRVDANGASFNYANFSYSWKNWGESWYRNTRHFGDVDKFTREELSDGRIKITNPLGKDTIYTISTIEGRKQITDIEGVATSHCLGTTKTLSYSPTGAEPDGYVYEKTERNGAVTRYTRNDRGLVLTKTEDADGPAPRITTYTWHSDHRVPLTRETSQIKETFVYASSGRLLSYTQEDVLAGSSNFGDVRTWTYNYTTNASGLELLASVDGPGLAPSVLDVTTYEYFADGSLKKVIDPNGLVTEILSTNSAGQPALIKGPDGIEWGFTYDVEGRVLTSVWDPNGTAPKTMSYSYDAVGQMTSMTNTLGNTWSYTYDEAKRLVRVVAPSGDSVDYTHDNMGNVVSTQYSDGAGASTFSTATEFDELGRLLKTIGGQSQTWTYSHDVEDNLASVSDPLGNATINTYGPRNRLVETQDRAGYKTTQDHNDSDLVTSYDHEKNLGNPINTSFEYNGFGDLTREISADRGTMTYVYDLRGLTTSATDARGIVTTYEYDHGGRLTAKRFPANPAEDQTFAYDLTHNGGADIFGVGKLSAVTDETGTTTTRYAQNGTVGEESRNIDGLDYKTSYSIDNEGNLAWVEYPSGRRVQYSYDDDNRITKVETRMQVETTPGSGVYPPWETVLEGATYLPNGPFFGLTYGDGSTHVAQYDNSYRLIGLKDETSLEFVLRDVNLGYTARDNIASITDTLDTLRDESFSYSARELMETATGSYASGSNGGAGLTWLYDGSGNRISQTKDDGTTSGTDTYSYAASSNLLSNLAESSGHTRNYTYDAAGNTIADSRLSGTHGYAYNNANRMSELSKDGVVFAQYRYNALGQQSVRTLTQTGEVFHSLHDLAGNRIAEYAVTPANPSNGTPASNTLSREYIWMGSQPVAVVEGGQLYYIRTDHIGRPVFATDDTGTKVWEVSYLPFGGVHVESGDAVDLRFPGQWFQAESGLHQNWMRDYDPTTGRYFRGGRLLWTDFEGDAPATVPPSLSSFGETMIKVRGRQFFARDNAHSDSKMKRTMLGEMGVGTNAREEEPAM